MFQTKEDLFRRTKAGAKPLQKYGSGNGLAIQVLCSRRKRVSKLDMMLMMVDGMTAMTGAMRPSY
jgi:hypothetical protein